MQWITQVLFRQHILASIFCWTALSQPVWHFNTCCEKNASQLSQQSAMGRWPLSVSNLETTIYTPGNCAGDLFGMVDPFKRSLWIIWQEALAVWITISCWNTRGSPGKLGLWIRNFRVNFTAWNLQFQPMSPPTGIVFSKGVYQIVSCARQGSLFLTILTSAPYFSLIFLPFTWKHSAIWKKPRVFQPSRPGANFGNLETFFSMSGRGIPSRIVSMLDRSSHASKAHQNGGFEASDH